MLRSIVEVARAAGLFVGLIVLGSLGVGVAMGHEPTSTKSGEVQRATPKPGGEHGSMSGHGHGPGGQRRQSDDGHAGGHEQGNQRGQERDTRNEHDRGGAHGNGHDGAGPHVHAPLPAGYRSEHVPAAAWTNRTLIVRGRDIYAAKCAVCHGDGGDGKGPAAAGLPLKPPDLRSSMVNEMAGNYWFWRVSEGGSAEPFRSRGSAMPAWKDDLSVEDRWAVIAYQHTFSGHDGPHVGSEHAELLGPGHGSIVAETPGAPANAGRPHTR